MSYVLGIDVGTSRTAAAIWCDGEVSAVPLGPRDGPGGAAVTLPTVVYLLDDGALLVGAQADERGAADPERVARGFWADLADPVPRLLGDELIGTGELAAAVIEYVVASATVAQGAPPAYVTLTCPASWSAHLRLAVTRTAQEAGLAEVGLVTDPVAATVHLAVTDSFPVGSRLLVIDAGAAFDVSVVERTATGYDVIGRPAREPGVGGDHVDACVLAHLRGVVGQQWPVDEADESDEALWRLRAAAVAAKEQLSFETATAIGVELPGVSRRVRYTRAELESAAGPLVERGLDIAREAVTAAGLTQRELAAVLLTGGMAAMPLVSRVVGEGLGVRVVVDRRPKLAVAFGAAVAASARLPETAPGRGSGPGPGPGPGSGLGAGAGAGSGPGRGPETAATGGFAPPTAAAPGTAGVDASLDDETAAALAAVEDTAVATDAPSTGITAPLDLPLPLRPDPNRAPRRVVGEVFEYAPPSRSLARAGVAAVVLLAVVAVVAGVAGLRVLLDPTDDTEAGNASASAVESSGATDGAAGGPGDGDVDRAEVVPIAVRSVDEASARLTDLVVLPGGELLVVGRAGEPTRPALWRSATVSADGLAPLVPAAAPSLAGGLRGSVAAVSVRGDLLVAVGWTAPDDSDPTDRSVRRGAIWLGEVTPGRPWRAVPAGSLPEVGELTAVAVRATGEIVAGGVDYSVDGGDGDGAVLVSADGESWRTVATTGLDGPGPYRLVALADSDTGLLAVAERRQGAALRSALARSVDGAAWEELGPLDGPPGAVAGVTDLAAAGPGRVFAVGGQQPDQALTWWGPPDAPVPGVVGELGPLTAMVRAGEFVVVAGRSGAAGEAPVVALLPDPGGAAG